MKMGWFSLALLSMFAFSAMWLAYRKLGELGLSSGAVFAYSFAISSAIIFLHLARGGASLAVDGQQLGLLAIASAASAAGNIWVLDSMKLSPNPGYSLAIISLNTILVAIASVFLFGSEVTLTNGIGLLLAVAGVIIFGL